MAFGDIQTGSSQEATTVTSHTVTLPTLKAGDYLLVLFSLDGTLSDIATTPTGWTRHAYNSFNGHNAYIFGRRSDGGEGATLTISTSAAAISSHVSVAVEKAQYNTRSFAWGTGTVIIAEDLFPSETQIDPFVLMTWFGVWESTLGISSWPAIFSEGRQETLQSGNNTGTASTLVRNTTSLSEAQRTFTKPQFGSWHGSIVSLTEDTSPPPSSPATVTSITGSTNASGSGTASPVSTSAITGSTNASGQTYINPIPEETNAATASGVVVASPVVQIIINGSTLAYGDIKGRTVGANSVTSIQATTEANGIMYVNPVSELALISSIAHASGNIEASPVATVGMTATAEATGSIDNSLPSIGSNCCCFEPTKGPQCRGGIGFRNWGYRTIQDSTCPSIVVGFEITFEISIYLWGDPGAIFNGKFEVLRNNTVIHSIDINVSNTLSYWWNGRGEPGDTITARWLGECELSKSCVLYQPLRNPSTTCNGDAGLCDSLNDVFEKYRYVPSATPDYQCGTLNSIEDFYIEWPTASVTISGLSGPLAAFNGTYTGRLNGCDNFGMRVCWKPEPFDFSTTYGIVFAYLYVSFSDNQMFASLWQIAGWNYTRFWWEMFGYGSDCESLDPGIGNPDWQDNSDFQRQAGWRLIRENTWNNPYDTVQHFFPVSSCDQICLYQNPPTQFPDALKRIGGTRFPQFTQEDPLLIPLGATSCEDWIVQFGGRVIDHCILDGNIEWSSPIE